MKPTILAEVIEDSIAQHGVRITTVKVRFPRIVAAELLRHRAFSQNSGSSRAKPISKMLDQVIFDPACPTEWGTNKPGMQAGAQLTGWRLKGAKAIWKSASLFAALHSWGLMMLGAHKQIANRVTEPYQYLDMLRCHPDADPTMRDLAIEIMTAIETSVPKLLRYNEWHLPYVLTEERRKLSLNDQLQFSAARCARISYEPFDGNPSQEKERDRYSKLVGSHPIHASPTEHQATPMLTSTATSGNLRGWHQHRKDVEISLKGLPTPPRLRRSMTLAETDKMANTPLTGAQLNGLRVMMDHAHLERPFERVFVEDLR
jgi:hypothetical protein